MPVCTAQIGSVQKGMLVNITSTSDFWIQLAGPISKINDSTKVCTDKMTEKPEVDTYCAVVLGEGFYKSKSQRTMSASVKVHKFFVTAISQYEVKYGKVILTNAARRYKK